MSFSHISHDAVRKFAECDDPTQTSWNAIVAIVDQLQVYLQLDCKDERVSFFVVDKRKEAFYASEEALGRRNRHEVQSAVREFFTF